MKPVKHYTQTTIQGTLLLPGFSVYLFVITVPDAGHSYYYAGMTGDPVYPSASSAIHRLGGHFENNPRSTQNRVKLAMERHQINPAGAIIHMYHWPLEGFEPWGSSLKGFSKNRLSKTDQKRYESYKAKRRKVAGLEQHLIYLIRNKHGKFCLNESTAKALDDALEFDHIIREVNKLTR